MVNIHISGYPGCGKTSICLNEVKKVLLDSGRVFWLSYTGIDFERFRQIIGDIPISKASKFHALQFSSDISHKDGFDTSIQQLIGMCDHLPSTQLVVIDGWDQGMEDFSKKLRFEKISNLVNSSKKNQFEIIATSLSYEDASNNSENYKIKAKVKFEDLEFENWLIIPDPKENNLRKIIKPNQITLYKIIQEGIKIMN